MRQHQLSPSTPHPPAPSYPFGYVDVDAKESTSSPSGVTGVTDTGVERRIVLPGGAEEAQEVHHEVVNQPHAPHQHLPHQQNIMLPQLQLSSEQQQQLQMQLQHMRTLQNVSDDQAVVSSVSLLSLSWICITKYRRFYGPMNDIS